MSYTDDISRFITPETLTQFCNTNECLFASGEAPSALIVELPGLGGSSCLGGCVDFGDYVTDDTRDYARHGILALYIFPGPWSWGSIGAVRMTDAVVDAAILKYGLPADVPITVCGGSMGGMGALLYAADTRHRLAAVGAACPGTDTLAAYEHNPEFRRTYISAVAGYDMPISEALKRISPVERIDEMPDIPYFICSDGEDECFPEEYCNEYVEKLRKKGKNVTYYRQEGLRHGYFSKEAGSAMHSFLMRAGK